MNGTFNWIVGLQFHTASGGSVRHFYLVHEATDRKRACEAALRRASTPGEYMARGGQPLDNSFSEVRMIATDPIGLVSYSD